MVRMRGVDLSLFQFDYDLTWAGLFMEPDGTVLGRYGAGSRDAMHYNSVLGFKNAMKRSLEIHQDLDNQKPWLLGKKQAQAAFKYPRDLPHDEIRKIAKNPTERKNCIHCHMVQEGLNRALEQKPNYHPDIVRSLFPAPEKFGVVFNVDHGLKVAKVLPKSGARKAGIRRGDVLTHASGQVLVSIADFIWALKTVSDPGVVEVKVQRGKKVLDLKVSLEKGWKPSDLGWRTSVFGMRPRLKLWVVDSNPKKRRRIGAKKSELALEVRGVFGPEVRKSGIKKGDFIIAVDKWKPNVGPKDFAQHIRINYFRPRAKIPVTVKRGKRTLKLVIQF